MHRTGQLEPLHNLTWEPIRILRSALPERTLNETDMCVLWVATWKPT